MDSRKGHMFPRRASWAASPLAGQLLRGNSRFKRLRTLQAVEDGSANARCR